MSTSSQNGATKYLVVLSEKFRELKKTLYEVLKDKRPFVPTYRDKKEVIINYYYIIIYVILLLLSVLQRV